MDQESSAIHRMGDEVTINHRIDKDGRRCRLIREVMQMDDQVEALLFSGDFNGVSHGAKNALYIVRDLFSDIVDMLERGV